MPTKNILSLTHSWHHTENQILIKLEIIIVVYEALSGEELVKQCRMTATKGAI